MEPTIRLDVEEEEIARTFCPVLTVFYNRRSETWFRMYGRKRIVEGKLVPSISPADAYVREYIHALYTVLDHGYRLASIDRLDRYYIARLIDREEVEIYRTSRPVSLLDFLHGDLVIVLTDEPVGAWTRTVEESCRELDRESIIMPQTVIGMLGISYWYRNRLYYKHREETYRLAGENLRTVRAVTWEPAVIRGFTIINMGYIEETIVTTEAFPDLAGRYNIHLIGIGDQPIHLIDGRVVREEPTEEGDIF